MALRHCSGSDGQLRRLIRLTRSHYLRDGLLAMALRYCVTGDRSRNSRPVTLQTE